jgi:PAS domain S-box-containing protein
MLSLQAFHTFLLKTALPLRHGWRTRPQLPFDLAIAHSISQRQNQSCTEDITRRQRSRLRPPLQLIPLFAIDPKQSLIISHILTTLVTRFMYRWDGPLDEADQAVRAAREALERMLNERTEQLRQELERTKQMASELRRSEERFRTLAQAVPILLWTTDADGYTTYVSARYEEFTGVPAKELVGNGWLAVLHPDDKDRVCAVWADAVQMHHEYEIEYRLRRVDGSYRWFVARGIPIEAPDNRIGQWLGSSTEIDEMKRTETALRRSNDELRQFAYAAAHDMQEPLRNVSHSLGMLKQLHSTTLDQATGRWIDTATEDTRRMYDMVKDLYSYAIAVEDEEEQPKPFEAAEGVQKALSKLRHLVAKTGAQVHSAELPAVRVHEKHLVQVFQNVLSNAMTYRKANTSPVIRISTSWKPPPWQFLVSDNGIGFNPEYSEKIFRVFKRLHSRNEYPGNGMGLALCARAVVHYGGRIWAESEPGQGTKVFLRCPQPRLGLCGSAATSGCRMVRSGGTPMYGTIHLAVFSALR